MNIAFKAPIEKFHNAFIALIRKRHVAFKAPRKCLQVWQCLMLGEMFVLREETREKRN